MNIREALVKGRQYLKEQQIDSFQLDAQVLLSQVTGIDRTGLFMRQEQPLTPQQQEKYQILLERRAQGEPVAYLIGRKEFMGRDFVVTPDVLIPRPDTELMVETAVKFFHKNSSCPPVAVDVGTGSGAIAVSLASLVQELQVYAIDLSEAALKVARQNAERLGMKERVHFQQGNLLEPLLKTMGEEVSIITANLPYVPSGDIPTLMRDVKEFEPHLALDGGPDGLDLYRLLIPQAYRLLQPGGLLLMEIGPGQGTGAKKILPAGQWQGTVLKDLAGRERLVLAEKKGEHF
ncbi:[protein release factor]-glutamine N5-methyltransferase [Desulforamulus reducens MI-1]|uniref:Release factor glutamine methyltransferase n=1 Tax=Desulforamulus reducens (strain ATCC BAA-1160 / DSM 100696 / MI-1) TaxID=349161 RepID=A4J9B8_DESRM|nr:peptide chain release factor N(5)-glutamine methyltransferase [Desulforamulus reducens]ABO51671.1 [protein release factor]-glutamine N5-methyltransferase [Desulforamulus reducens MI-1]